MSDVHTMAPAMLCAQTRALAEERAPAESGLAPDGALVSTGLLGCPVPSEPWWSPCTVCTLYVCTCARQPHGAHTLAGLRIRVAG